VRVGKWKNKIVALVAIIAALLTFLSNLNSATDFFRLIYVVLFSKDNLKISVIQARLVPTRPRADISSSMDDDAFVALQLRNYGRAPVLLTSAELTLLNSHDASTQGSTGGGICMLSANPDENRSPVMLEPGQTKWVAAAMALRFNGLLESLNGSEFDRLYVVDAAPNVPYTISYSGYVKEFNSLMAKHYGANSAVKVTFRINLDENEINYTIPLTTGGDISSQGERFQHDWFIAHLKKPSFVPYLNLSDPECNIDKFFPKSIK